MALENADSSFDETDPLIAVDDVLLRHLEKGDYLATIEPTRRLSLSRLDRLYDDTSAALPPNVNIGVTLKCFQHVRANLNYYVSYFAAKERVTYFCTDHLEEAIRIRLILGQAGKNQRILLLYAGAPEFADLYAKYDIEICVFEPRWIERALRYKSTREVPLRIHLWFDVGMSREGLLPTDVTAILPALRNEEIFVEGVATHLNSVLKDHPLQKGRLESVLRTLEVNGIRPHVVHAVASHSGLGYNDFTGTLSVSRTAVDVFYDMVRAGSSLGMAARFRSMNRSSEVLRIAIPIRTARIAHIKQVPAGWNVGYWDNKLQVEKRIAVLESVRLNVANHESFHRRNGPQCESIKTLLCHGRIACLELSDGEWHVEDMIYCDAPIWISFLSKSFVRTADGKTLVTLKDVRTDQTTRIPVVTSRDLPNEYLLRCIDQFATGIFMRQLEHLTYPRRQALFTKSFLVRIAFVVLLISRRIPILRGIIRSRLAPVCCS